MIDLALLLAFMIAFAVAAYVVMDGFDLGIGILSSFIPAGQERNQAINSIAPVWDGNETWLVFGGAGLLAAFPLAYSIILPALYAPIFAMLLGLIFRGVAFEFRWHKPGGRYWDIGLFIGSLVATFAQGVTLGALVQGIRVAGRSYAGGWWDWLTAFSLVTGAGLVVGYALLGASWLIWKSDGPLHQRARGWARLLLPCLLVAIVAVSLATPFTQPQYHQRWFAVPGLLVTIAISIAFAVCAWFAWQSYSGERHSAPFWWSLTLFLLSLVGLAISIWPDIVPGQISIWQAAAPHSTQVFTFAGGAVLLPMILAYTAWAYWVFRGKVGEEGYH